MSELGPGFLYFDTIDSFPQALTVSVASAVPADIISGGRRRNDETSEGKRAMEVSRYRASTPKAFGYIAITSYSSGRTFPSLQSHQKRPSQRVFFFFFFLKYHPTTDLSNTCQVDAKSDVKSDVTIYPPVWMRAQPPCESGDLVHTSTGDLQVHRHPPHRVGAVRIDTFQG